MNVFCRDDDDANRVFVSTSNGIVVAVELLVADDNDVR